MKNLIYTLFIVITSFTINAQTTDTKAVQNNYWFSYSGNHKLSEKWGLNTDLQWRRSENLNHPMQNVMLFGLDYKCNKNIAASAGYSFIKIYAYGDFSKEIPAKYNQYDAIQNLIWEQLAIKHSNIGRFLLDSRFRLEQRWIQNKVLNSDGQYVLDNETISGTNAEPIKFRQRLRYRYRVQLPINNTELKDNTLFLVVSDEIFVNIGKGTAANIFDQNRLALGLGWRFTNDFNIQAAYMNQFIEKSDGKHKENNHTLVLGITYNLDFIKLFQSNK